MTRQGDTGYPSPEEAARGDIPARYARALSVAVSPDGSEAFVLLATNEEPAIELYEVVCYREGDRWLAGMGSGGAGFGWSSSSVGEDGQPVGVLRLTGEAPADVEAVVVRWRGEEECIPVVGGYFVFTRWNVRASFEEAFGHPRAVRYVKRDGTEAAVPVDPLREQAWNFLGQHRSETPLREEYRRERPGRAGC